MDMEMAEVGASEDETDASEHSVDIHSSGNETEDDESNMENEVVTSSGANQNNNSQQEVTASAREIDQQSLSCQDHVEPKEKSFHSYATKYDAKSNMESMEDEGQICTICFEPWTNSSEHRLVSLRCGHLFGRSCISRWLKGQSSRCPQCNARARKSEIRNIYAKAIKVLDTSERDRAVSNLKNEMELRRKAEITAAQERLKYMMSVQECERLKKELMEANKLLQEFRAGKMLTDDSTKVHRSAFSLEKSIDIFKKGGCRIIDACELLGMILVSQPSTNELFPGYGFRKISTQDMKPSEFVLVHQKPVKDMAIHANDGLVLTGSLDKTVKLTNSLTNSVVQTYFVEHDVWSCAWDTDDPVYFYAGMKNGDVYLFDIRATNKWIHAIPKLGNNTPVVSLQYLRNKTHSGRRCGPVVGKLSDCAFFEKLEQRSEYKPTHLPTLGPFTSLSVEPTSGNFLVSCRPSPKQPRINHTICEFVESESGDLICNPLQMMLAGSNQVQLTRSKVLSHPDRESSLLVCAGDEDASGALIWDGSSGARIDHLSSESSVLDIAGLKLNQKHFLMTLTDKILRLYRWTGD